MRTTETSFFGWRQWKTDEMSRTVPLPPSIRFAFIQF
jgi:hypothetical protein